MTDKDTAFRETDFNWVSTLHSVWRDPPGHVDALHGATVETILGNFSKLRPTDAQTIVGQAVNGEAGSGKTHLIGTLRQRVWKQGGWFVLIDIVGITDFWRTAAFAFIRSLRQRMPDGRWQYQAVFEEALRRVPQAKKREVMTSGEDLGSGAIKTVNVFVKILRNTFDGGMEHGNVVRALLLQGDPDAAEIAYSWLQGLELDPEDRRALGLTGPSPPPEKIVAGISWLMSLGGPTMIAIDQIDAIVTAGNIIADKTADLDDETEARARTIVHLLTGGLMDLYDQTSRSMTIVTCLTETWEIIRSRALRAAGDRFNLSSIELKSAANRPDTIAALVAGRLASAFKRHGVTPPYPTWPFRPEALAALEGHWPRRVLMLCDAYRQRHLDAATVPECFSLFEPEGKGVAAPDDLAADFAAYRAKAMITDLAAGLDDGGLLGKCLRETLQLYIRQLDLPESVDVTIGALANDARPALHARLTFIFHDQKELEKHFCFRAIPHPSALAVQPRLRAAMTDSGIDRKLPFRHLVIVRNDPMPSGKVTKQLADTLLGDGGLIVGLSTDDLRVFVALRDMDAAKVKGFDAWLKRARPLCDTAFFKAIGLCPPPISPVEPFANARQALAEAAPGMPEPAIANGATSPIKPAAPLAKRLAPKSPNPEAPAPTSSDAKTPAPAARAPEASERGARDPEATIPLGPRLEGGARGPRAELPVALLTRHTAIFAGSGSGKTVLLRRLVEEAALLGIPAIVIDTNNDLARLGQAWPSRPEAFDDADAAKAARYIRDTEVIIWTPGVAAGRPLTLAVLPDFAAIPDGDERDQAVDMAWATLVPLIGATGASKDLKQGLLREALTTFARARRTGIEAFIDFLADLPADVSKQSKAQKLSGDISDQLRAKIAVNPLLNAVGQPLDPAVLFTAARPGATRISVINFAGLASDQSRQDFVNQLQMALFTYIRKHPSKTPRLYVLDEAQNFAPSMTATASKASATALAAQARKFGLGMIFATQAPKGIDTKIVSNCVTHFYGRMSSPALIDATKDMMAARGKAAEDLSGLSSGIFYFSTEGVPRPIKIKTPLCLSHHPQNPASPEEIVAMARE
jgi:hypothetical protein